MKRKWGYIVIVLLVCSFCFIVSACTDNGKTLNLNYTNYTMEVGETVSLKATSSSDEHIEWQTSNFAYASVYNGIVTAKKAGRVTITATQGKSTATCTLTIKEASISLNYSSLRLSVGDLQLLIVKSNSNANISWRSSNFSVATVSAVGMVQAKKAGTATITATQGNAKVTCVVVVK